MSSYHDPVSLRDSLDLSVYSKLGRVAGIQQTSNNWPMMTVIHPLKHFLKGYVLVLLQVDQNMSPELTELLFEQRKQRKQTTHCIQWDSVGAMTEKPERALEAPRGK